MGETLIYNKIIQDLISRFPTLYILFNVNETGIKNAMINMRGYNAIKKSQSLDIEFYLNEYSDVKLSGMDPILHYLYHGFKEGKKPNPQFNGNYYLKKYPDVERSNLNPLVHYLLYGKKEQRTPYIISIIIPVYNMEKYIHSTLNSVINQTIGFENLEVIMVNDCSTDKCGEIINKYASNYENFKAISLPENSGSAGKPRNIGMESATGKYLMFLDHDDCYTARACEILYNNITRENVDIVFSNFIRIFEDGTRRKGERYLRNKDKPQVKTIEDTPRLLAVAPSVWTKMYRKKFIIDKGIKFKERIPNEDLVFVLNAFLEAKGIVYFENRFLYNHRVRNSDLNVSLSRKKSMKNLMLMVQGYYEALKVLDKFRKRKCFPILFRGHLEFWTNNLISSNTSPSEKNGLLKEIGPLFEEFKAHKGKPVREYLIPIFNNISEKEYDKAASIIESLKNDLIPKQGEYGS